MLCQYRSIFGEPHQGIHKHRIFGLAIVDVILTILLVYFIHIWTKITILKISVIIIVLFVMVHRIFCVNTTINKWLFGKLL